MGHFDAQKRGMGMATVVNPFQVRVDACGRSYISHAIGFPGGWEIETRDQKVMTYVHHGDRHRHAVEVGHQ